jgi:hypothetical protein
MVNAPLACGSGSRRQFHWVEHVLPTLGVIRSRDGCKSLNGGSVRDVAVWIRGTLLSSREAMKRKGAAGLAAVYRKSSAAEEEFTGIVNRLDRLARPQSGWDPYEVWRTRVKVSSGVMQERERDPTSSARITSAGLGSGRRSWGRALVPLKRSFKLPDQVNKERGELPSRTCLATATKPTTPRRPLRSFS